MLQGYSDPGYAAAFAEFGTPRLLSRSGGWILERVVGDGPYRDAMGCYPVFACEDWSRLSEDLARLEDLVCLSLVADPFAALDQGTLERSFPDLAIPFKSHFVVDLAVPFEQATDAHHRRNVRRSSAIVEVDVVADPEDALADWIKLYSVLVDRHQIRGMRAFSPGSFQMQMSVPSLVAFRARAGGQTVGMLLWFVSGEVAYYHLGAYNALGYQVQASFALFATAIGYFRDRLSWLSLGAGAGLTGDATDGLSRFKRGWSTGTRMAFLCGRIFDRKAYRHLVAATGATGIPYFPAYRSREFAA